MSGTRVWGIWHWLMTVLILLCVTFTLNVNIGIRFCYHYYLSFSRLLRRWTKLKRNTGWEAEILGHDSYETLLHIIQHFGPSSKGSFFFFCGGDRQWILGVSRDAVISKCKDCLQNPCSRSFARGGKARLIYLALCTEQSCCTCHLW